MMKYRAKYRALIYGADKSDRDIFSASCAGTSVISMAEDAAASTEEGH
jgi:hypothetical protein